ncbi:MAG TPA: ABC transporter permease [Dongiaceae bacterium]|jgi:spermidine/putrescine transport system permease protein|nr:ABC transporter permease [Dongiaceae bacterium]
MTDLAAAPIFTSSRLRWDRWRTAALGQFPLIVTIAAYLFLFVPLLVLMAYSFNASRSTVVWSGFTFDWYVQVFEDRRLRGALANSAIIALVSAALSTTIGTVTALAIVRRNFPGRDALSTVLMAPLVLPEIVIAVAFLVFMVFVNVKLGFFTLIAGHILVSLPFTILIVRAAASALDRRLEEAAADLGADEVQTFVRVTMPLLMPAVFTAFLMAATLSFDNFVMSTFATGVGTTTLPLHIYSLLKLGITPKINAMGTLLVLVNVLLVIIVLGRQLRLVLRR